MLLQKSFCNLHRDHKRKLWQNTHKLQAIMLILTLCTCYEGCLRKQGVPCMRLDTLQPEYRRRRSQSSSLYNGSFCNAQQVVRALTSSPIMKTESSLTISSSKAELSASLTVSCTYIHRGLPHPRVAHGSIRNCPDHVLNCRSIIGNEISRSLV